jgi:hypothetical protein
MEEAWLTVVCERFFVRTYIVISRDDVVAENSRGRLDANRFDQFITHAAGHSLHIADATPLRHRD